MKREEMRKKQTTIRTGRKLSPEKSVKMSYYDGLQDQQDEFDREMMRKKPISKKTDTPQQ